MQTVVADKDCVTNFCSNANQTGKIFHPYVVVGFFRSRDQKEIDVMRTVTFFAHINGTKPPLSPPHRTFTPIEGFCLSNFGTSLTARGKVRPEMSRVFS